MKYKTEVITSAIEGLEKAGFDQARLFQTLFEKIYDCGFNECARIMTYEEMRRDRYEMEDRENFR